MCPEELIYGYENASARMEQGDPVLIVQEEWQAKAIQDWGVPVICIKGSIEQAAKDLLTEWGLVFAFTDREFRVKVGKVLDGYVNQLCNIEQIKVDLGQYIREGGNGERLYALANEAYRYEYRDELEVIRNGFTATRYLRRDPSTIPPREWLYGRHFLRKYVSVTIAPGGVGKSRLLTGEILAMVSGKRLFDVWAGEPLRVWLWNLEDDQEELARCIEAACKFHNISEQDIGGRLFVDSGRNTALCTAQTGRSGAEILTPVYDAVIAELIRRKIDLLVIDPFVSSHKVAENDNGMIDAVVKAWALVAEKANCAIELVHHTRKENGGQITADSTRGGSAIVGAARDVRVLNRMDETTASGFGIERDEARQYFNLQSDKANFAPIESRQWYHIKGLDLKNGTPERCGDNVGVCQRWYPPDAFEGLTEAMTNKALSIIGIGNCKYSPQSPEWGGHQIAKSLEVDTSTAVGLGKMKKILRAWEDNKIIRKVKQKDSLHKVRPFYELIQN